MFDSVPSVTIIRYAYCVLGQGVGVSRGSDSILLVISLNINRKQITITATVGKVISKTDPYVLFSNIQYLEEIPIVRIVVIYFLVRISCDSICHMGSRFSFRLKSQEGRENG
jgi:hypothetical protein